MRPELIRTSARARGLAIAALAIACAAAPASAAGKAPARSVAPASGSARTSAPAPGPARASAPGDSTLTLKGGQEGTVFHTLTIEGEDRIHFEVERPVLKLEIDPTTAPGLEWGTARDVLDRTTPDVLAPLLSRSAFEPSPYVSHPWLSHFASGAVARFHPEVKGAERWTLTIASARGVPVAVYKGSGDPPRELAWDGRSTTGAPVIPGMTYSYVFEAVDRAGNHRHFVGEGFRVSAYRLSTEQGCLLVFAGAEIAPPPVAVTRPGSAPDDAAPVLVEAATWINEASQPPQTVMVTATARSADEASRLAGLVTAALSSRLVGDAARVRAVTRVEPDAPEGGAIAIETGRAPARPAAQR